ncbi:uncharacterized protein Tco025E_02708 [Trypanosoma conorhini]|uniref:Uncharacterized protein n=1 Tax=Trypanosoma conorhini TaxID=83891 RepID=A0A422Q1K7_9TRYP|nr:uncharacterized protein Tco025E_02708 [Trypanosoma conorhini]RNF23807.1 hypothetical protein Tco025E_02708 [Trypanosoma conorhini]
MVLPFGLDDVLLLVASASPLLWAKRGDVVRSSVYKTVSFVTGDDAYAARRAEAVARNCPTPCALLPGKDLGGPTPTASAATDTLVVSGIAGSFTGDVVHEYPCVPHRHFHRMKQRRPPVRDLLQCSVKEVAASLHSYSLAEVSRLYETMEQEGLWEAALNVTEGSRRGRHYAYLTKRNLEAVLRTLLRAGETQRAIQCYLAHAKEFLVSDEVLVALFDACRQVEQNSLALYQAVKPFHDEWTLAVYACCLTVNAQFNWEEALHLYSEYLEKERQPRFTRLVASVMRSTDHKSSVNEVGSGVGSVKGQQLQFLYHVILPLVADRRVDRLQECYAHMLAREPESTVDVLLRCLHTPRGRELAAHWLKASVKNAKDPPLIPDTVVDLATQLYSKKPNVMNLNSLLKVLMAQDPTMLPSHVGEKLQEYVRPLAMTENDACVLARTLTGQSGHWKLATHFMASMVARKQFGALPTLSFYVAKQGRWLLASQAMTLCFSNRAAVAPAEINLCIESSVLAGRWKSALFWMERAHSRGVRLPTAVYDDVLGVTKHCSWVAALRALASMHEAGSASSEAGVLTVLEATASQGKALKALNAISTTGNVYWTL